MALPTPQHLLSQLPLSKDLISFILSSRQEIRNILERKSPRLLLVIGPCSIHNLEEGLLFAKKLKNLSDKVKKEALIVMRAYIEKPRTRGGWQGFVHDPYLDGSNQLNKGLFLSRSFLIALADLRLPAAVEFVTPSLAPYYEDLVSWGCIGARTSTSQPHRLLASHLMMPVGIKNTVEGDIDAAIDGVFVASQPHSFPHIDLQGKLSQVKSQGNPHAHVVLRGSKTKTNYDVKTIEETAEKLNRLSLRPLLLIDCSHGNCRGDYTNQKSVFYTILEQFHQGNQHILGMMLESQMEANSQSLSTQPLEFGVSVTDPCLDFSSTEELVSAVSSSTVMSFTQS